MTLKFLLTCNPECETCHGEPLRDFVNLRDWQEPGDRRIGEQNKSLCHCVRVARERPWWKFWRKSA